MAHGPSSAGVCVCTRMQGALPAAPTGVDASILYGGRAHRRIPLPTALVDRPAVVCREDKSSFARTDRIQDTWYIRYAMVMEHMRDADG